MREKLPHEVVSHLHHVLRLAYVFGALLVRVQLNASSRFTNGDQLLLYVVAEFNVRIVRPLKVEERVLEGERGDHACVVAYSEPSVTEANEFR